MKRIIELDGRTVEYDLERKNVKNLNLRIKADQSVYVSANHKVSEKTIQDFLQSKSDYILKALDRYAEMAKYAAKIIDRRNEFLKTLSPLAEEAHAALSGGREELKISAESGWQGSEAEIADGVAKALKASYEKDMRLGFTNVGPHRDDMKILLNGEDVKIYGSQGQQRTVALSVKLAETEIFKSRFNEYPVLILDDVLSELDRVRRRRLIARLNGIQTIITCTNAEKSVFGDTPYKKMTVADGKLKKPAAKD